tara:strand:+ start:234 stop:521 length:288 start_codon:yes stop_codon:yes gene_type:complete
MNQDNEWTEIISEHRNRLLSEDTEKAELFIQGSTSKIISLIDKVQDDDLAEELLGFAGVFLGAMGGAFIKLRMENDMLREELLKDYVSKQKPKRN